MAKIKKENLSFTLEGGHIKLPIDNIHQHLQEINRGVGIEKPKKGKGSYKRKDKHNKKYF